MRPPTFDPTRISRASTVPEPCNDESRENHPSEYAMPAKTAASTTTMITTRLPIRFSCNIYDFAAPEVTRLARNKSRPQNIDRPIHSLRQRIVAVHRPQQHRPKCHLPEHARHLKRRDIPPKLPRSCPICTISANNLSPRVFLSRITFRTDTDERFACSNARITSGFLAGSPSSAATSCGKMRASALCRFARSHKSLELAHLHVAECDEDVFFAREIIEKRALAHVGGVRDVLDGRLCESLFRENRIAAWKSRSRVSALRRSVDLRLRAECAYDDRVPFATISVMTRTH